MLSRRAGLSAIAGLSCLLARGCCVPTPTQRAIPPGSVNEYQRKLGSQRAYHVMHWPRIRGLAASAGVQLRVTGNGDQRRPMALAARERILLLLESTSAVRYKNTKNIWQNPEMVSVLYFWWADTLIISPGEG